MRSRDGRIAGNITEDDALGLKGLCRQFGIPLRRHQQITRRQAHPSRGVDEHDVFVLILNAYRIEPGAQLRFGLRLRDAAHYVRNGRHKLGAGHRYRCVAEPLGAPGRHLLRLLIGNLIDPLPELDVKLSFVSRVGVAADHQNRRDEHQEHDDVDARARTGGRSGPASHDRKADILARPPRVSREKAELLLAGAVGAANTHHAEFRQFEPAGTGSRAASLSRDRLLRRVLRASLTRGVR